MSGKSARNHEQPRHESLDELLRDPIAALLMASDGVDPAQVRALLGSRPRQSEAGPPLPTRLRSGSSARRGARHS